MSNESVCKLIVSRQLSHAKLALDSLVADSGEAADANCWNSAIPTVVGKKQEWVKRLFFFFQDFDCWCTRYCFWHFHSLIFCPKYLFFGGMVVQQVALLPHSLRLSGLILDLGYCPLPSLFPVLWFSGALRLFSACLSYVTSDIVLRHFPLYRSLVPERFQRSPAANWCSSCTRWQAMAAFASGFPPQTWFEERACLKSIVKG